MVQAGFARPKRSVPRWVWPGLCLALGGWLAVSGGGCSPEVTDTTAATADDTIGHYCDQLLPTFCAYAVNVCGADGPVARCVDNSRAICCQGACSRPARLVGDLSACTNAYAGREAGVDEAGEAVPAVSGRPCGEVLAGLSPAECQGVVELLTQPAVDQAQ